MSTDKGLDQKDVVYSRNGSRKMEFYHLLQNSEFKGIRCRKASQNDKEKCWTIIVTIQESKENKARRKGQSGIRDSSRKKVLFD